MKLELAGHCPGCGSHLTGCAAAEKAGEPGDPFVVPKPGDWTICIVCATPLVFGENNSLRKLTVGDYRDGDADDKQILTASVAAARLVAGLPAVSDVEEILAP